MNGQSISPLLKKNLVLEKKAKAIEILFETNPLIL